MEEVSNPSSHLPSLLLRPRAETRQCWSAPISLPGSPEKEVMLSNHGNSEQTGRDVELWSGSSTLRFLGAQHLRNLVTTSCNKIEGVSFPTPIPLSSTHMWLPRSRWSATNHVARRCSALPRSHAPVGSRRRHVWRRRQHLNPASRHFLQRPLTTSHLLG